MDSTGSAAELVIDDGLAEQETGQALLQLAPCLDLGEADALCHALRSRLLAGAICLDGSQVERASTVCLQIIAASVATAHDRGAIFSLRYPSPALSSAIADLGLSAAIPLVD
ncbi:STAS domain-containing protein [Lichenicola sp.]|uniref:STAS domain-containing protein n=1 Tax=Lichenicola sp. TaxID=2804529 RepID=UPI003B009E4E